MSKLYQYNLFLLWFKNPEIERKYCQTNFKQDLNSVRIVIFLGIALSIIFVFIDVVRYGPDLIAIAFRAGTGLLLIILGGITYLFKKENHLLNQYLGLLISIIVSAFFFLQSYFNTVPNFDIFLSNILIVIIFITSTIIGIRFRFALLINSINFIAYTLYVHAIDSSLIAERQVLQLLVIYMVGILASYLLERQKMNAFVHKNELDLEMGKVDELNRVKNKLFSIISHDLRGPITSLKGILSLYKRDSITEKEFKKLTHNLEQDLYSSSNLLDNLLAWSKSQLEGLDLRIEAFNPYKKIEKIKRLFSSQLKDKGIQLKVSIPDDWLVLGDRETMLIVFRNIISNSIKFTPHGGEICISAQVTKKDTIEISISDTGVGISAEKIDQLFQLSKETIIGTSNSNGAGIGLLLVKEFVELNNGQISVTSTIGSGTTFKLELPKA